MDELTRFAISQEHISMAGVLAFTSDWLAVRRELVGVDHVMLATLAARWVTLVAELRQREHGGDRTAARAAAVRRWQDDVDLVTDLVQGWPGDIVPDDWTDELG